MTQKKITLPVIMAQCRDDRQCFVLIGDQKVLARSHS